MWWKMKVYLLRQFLMGAAVVTSNHRGQPERICNKEVPVHGASLPVQWLGNQGALVGWKGTSQQHSSPPEGTMLSKTEALSSRRPSLLPILWETTLSGKTASYSPQLPGSNVFPRVCQGLPPWNRSPTVPVAVPLSSSFSGRLHPSCHDSGSPPAAGAEGHGAPSLPHTPARWRGTQLHTALSHADPALSRLKALMAIILWVRGDQPATE